MKILRDAVLAVCLSLPLAVNAETIEMQVNGLVCAFCAQGIEKNLRKQSATEDVFVSLKDGLVAVALKAGASVTDESLRELLREAGYTLVDVRRGDTPLAELRARHQP